jgi:hypothetical protein
LKLFYYIRRFWEFPGVEKKLLIQGVIFSFYTIVTTSFLPLRKYFKLLKSNIHINNEFNDINALILLVKKTIFRINRIVPWQVNCLNKVLTSKYLYRRLGIGCKVILSVSKKGGLLRSAHASLLIEKSIHYLQKQNNQIVCIIE